MMSASSESAFVGLPLENVAEVCNNIVFVENYRAV